jgi:flagellar basal body-associated protein FliL
MSATDRSELDGYEALVSELRATPPVAPERLRERVLGLAPGARARMSKRRRLVFVVVPVAVVLAVGAALVHGLVSSGSHPVANNAALRTFKELAPLTRTTPSAAQGSAQKAPSYHAPIPVTGTTHGSVAAAPALRRELRHSTFSTDALNIPKNRLVHAEASLQVSVKNHAALSKATNQATQIVASLGGYAQSVNYQSAHGGQGDAVLQLRVPVQKAQIAIGRLAGLGTLLSQQVSTKDLQQQLTSQNNGIGSLKRAIAVYEQALQSATLSATERVTIQIKLSNARHAIMQLRRNRTATLQAGATSNISLLLTTRQHAFVVTHHHGSTRVGRLLGSAAHFLALEGIIVLYALIVVAPLLVIGGLAWWVLRERRRREERLLASA